MKELIILGAGGFAREVMWVALRTKDFKVIAMLDETVDAQSQKKIHEVPVVSSLSEYLNNFDKDDRPQLICGTGNNQLRHRWASQYEKEFIFATLIDPTASIGPNVKVGMGTVVTSGCILTVDIRVGNHVNINLNCTVGHDTVIENFVNISPISGISGNVSILKGSDLGTGCIIVPKKTIGSNSIIGAGSVVTSDIPDNSIAVGIPAKVIKQTQPYKFA